jgi:hypothetical protein
VTSKNARIFRVALGFWLFGWFVNAEGFLKNFFDALEFPIDYDAFPAALRHPGVALAVYLAPVVGLPAFVRPAQTIAKITCPILAALALIACVHLETCNDATFLTSFWSALWLAWLAFNGDRSDQGFTLQARALAQSVVGLMFLGAAVGKLTPEYRSGEAFFGLYFRDNESFPYAWMKQNLPAPEVRAIATWFSRFAISAELVLAASPLFSARFVLAGSFMTMLAMMLAWTFHLASVLSCLFGLAVAAYMLERGEAAPAAATTPTARGASPAR